MGFLVSLLRCGDCAGRGRIHPGPLVNPLSVSRLDLDALLSFDRRKGRNVNASLVSAFGFAVKRVVACMVRSVPAAGKTVTRK